MYYHTDFILKHMARIRTENFCKEIWLSASALFWSPKNWADDIDFALENFFLASSVSWIWRGWHGITKKDRHQRLSKKAQFFYVNCKFKQTIQLANSKWNKFIVIVEPICDNISNLQNQRKKKIYIYIHKNNQT